MLMLGVNGRSWATSDPVSRPAVVICVCSRFGRNQVPVLVETIQFKTTPAVKYRSITARGVGGRTRR